MRVLSRQASPAVRAEGQLSDGSDRVEVVFIEHVVQVQDDLGRELILYFDHDPTDAEVLAALPDPPELTPTSKADFERGPLADRFATWQRWRLTKAEAQARSAGSAIVNALQQREDAAWSAYLQALQAWRNAP